MIAQGHRGYVFSRSVKGSRAPQHIQNLVIRDYAAKNGLLYKLSATEYAMENSYLMLCKVMDELASLEGVILYSMMLLPSDPELRQQIYKRIIESKSSLHAAVEDMALESWENAERWEAILLTDEICGNTSYQEIEKWLV